MQLIDTHCHIHDSEFATRFNKTPEAIIDESIAAGVNTLICVGTDVKSSNQAVQLAGKHAGCYPTIALHPHEAADKEITVLAKEFSELEALMEEQSENIVAVGECGLDYFYHDTEEVKDKQRQVFRWHIELALLYDKPLVFHIRDAFEDFFKIIDEYEGISGVVHSFTAGKDEVAEIVKRGLYAGLNGIITFTKENYQLEAAKLLPIENLVVETDAPFLTPHPIRGKVNEPRHVILITQFLSELRDEPQALLAKKTSENAKRLFKLN